MLFKKKKEKPLSQDDRHHVRNAAAGIALERRHMITALNMLSMATKAIAGHLERIDEALKEADPWP